MAKESMKAREVKRAKLVARYAEKRAALKQIVRTGDPAEAFEAAQKLQDLPKNSNPIRMHNRCKLTGRPKGYIRQFGISRIQFREMASNGLIPGVKLEELGYIVDADSLDKIDAVTKAHIASNIVENKANEELLLKTFCYVPERGEFIETIMNEGCPCYVEKETISPIEASDLIREAGGKVVLAHPVAYKYEDGLTDDDILELVRKMKPDGIEANYIYVDRNGNKINESRHWNDFAKHHNLITTIGSDFHKVDNVHPDIGLINEDITLDDKEVNTIIDNLLN